jgi:transcriptional regulator with XRE-family HTH domain
MKVGEKIKKLRELRNYTQQYLADELDISLSGYGKIERDQTEITLVRLTKICSILEVDLHALLHFNGDNFFQNHRMVEEPPKSEANLLQNQLLQQFKEENEYLKQLVKQLIENRASCQSYKVGNNFVNLPL